MGEGESTSVGWRIQPLYKLQETDQAVPSPVGRERVRVRGILFPAPSPSHLVGGLESEDFESLSQCGSGETRQNEA